MTQEQISVQQRHQWMIDTKNKLDTTDLLFTINTKITDDLRTLLNQADEAFSLAKDLKSLLTTSELYIKIIIAAEQVQAWDVMSYCAFEAE